ncbi:hypothetical protein GPECTOR_77g16 [Gonium pectorale]|uniref:Uncharacterized protein n=1 Tax=Gonium pectorale TaxID=33097 RepID=A0A150G214_GONPE|nr:hypothetical protein GPECTOR_77g16 [Gonium pectorale]|eukprot:KXZ43919.1 hypothetical protein GPECTOR_77g16 [Gonium pectorale]
MVKLPFPGRTEVARMVTGALRQALQREQLGELVVSQTHTPMHFNPGAGLIGVCHGGIEDLYWVRCPDAALVPCSQSHPSLVVEVGMPGESHFGLQERCRSWFCEPYADNYMYEKNFQPTSVISLHIRPWQGSEQHLITASLLVQGEKIREEESVAFVTSSAVHSGCQGGSTGSTVSGDAVWHIPVRYLLGSLAAGSKKEKEREEGDGGGANEEGGLAAVTVELDMPAALAGVKMALCGPG